MNVLTECLAQGTSPVGVVSFAKEYLKQQGFEELYYNKMISPKENSKYYIAISRCIICLYNRCWKRNDSVFAYGICTCGSALF